MRYNLSLINTDPSLDLTTKKTEIIDALKLIETGGINHNKYSSVSSIQVINISKRTIQLDVIENSKSKTWHMHVGYELANNYGMRDFCYIDSSIKNKELMFQWH